MLRKLASDRAARKAARRVEIGQNMTDPMARRRAHWHVFWADHAVLRTFWTNFDQVAPGVFRSNHPGHRRLAAYKARGIKAVLNLRGTPQRAHHLFEVESCEALGLELVSVSLHARKPADRDDMLALFDAFDRISRPFVMHCKSGADRAGLASALYLLDQGASLDEARRQLSVRYLHLKFTKTGVQDHMLGLYEKRLEQGPISIRDWVADEYDPDVLAASFANLRTLPI